MSANDDVHIPREEDQQGHLHLLGVVVDQKVQDEVVVSTLSVFSGTA